MVQTSANVKDFETIGRVDGNGTTIKTSSYNFNDENPLNGKNYYRLKQTDFDGKFSYSNTINLYHEHSDVSVFPNPNDGSFTIKIMTENNAYKLDIIDVHGKVAYVSSGSNIPEFIEVNNLAKGMYFLRLYVDDQIITRKIVVQ
ncbi:MAG: T9SS type A sorting domain-containing protein [Cytophagaceae bacterium]